MKKLRDLPPKSRASYHRLLASWLRLIHPDPGEAGRQVIAAILERADEIEGAS